MREPTTHRQISTSISVDEQVWKDFKKKAVDENKWFGDFLEEALRDKLKPKKGGG